NTPFSGDDNSSMIRPSPYPSNTASAARKCKRKAGTKPGFSVQMSGKTKDGSVNSVLQALAGREFRHVASRNLHFGTGLRIATGGSFTLRNREISETDQANLAALFQFIGDDRENR